MRDRAIWCVGSWLRGGWHDCRGSGYTLDVRLARRMTRGEAEELVDGAGKDEEGNDHEFLALHPLFHHLVRGHHSELPWPPGDER